MSAVPPCGKAASTKDEQKRMDERCSDLKLVGEFYIAIIERKFRERTGGKKRRGRILIRKRRLETRIRQGANSTRKRG